MKPAAARAPAAGPWPAGTAGTAEAAWRLRRAVRPPVRMAIAPATFTGLAIALLLGAVVTGRVQLVALAAPLAVAAVAGLARDAPGTLDVAVALDRLLTVEGEPVTVRVDVSAGAPVDRLEVAIEVDGALARPRPAGRVAATPPPARVIAVGRRLRSRGRARAAGTAGIAVPCPRWGVGGVVALALRWRDAAGFTVRSARVELGALVRVLPRPELVGTLVRPADTQLATGNAVSRALGHGVEFGEVRPYRPGDRRQAVNWRVSARRRGLWVTDRHLERNVDVVLALDAVLPEALLPAVRAAVALTEAYLAERDRVGLIGIGGTLRWLRPSGGTAGRHRVVEELIGAQAFAAEAAPGEPLPPPRALPPGALVVALTSLLDDRSAGLLLALRDRGLAMAVVEVGVPVGAGGDRVEAIADRLWRLRRDGRRDRLRARGVPVARWCEGEPLEVALAEIGAFRRALRRPAG